MFWLNFDRENHSFRLGGNRFSKSSISSFESGTVAWVKMHVFSVCTYLLNCLRSLDTMVITRESDWNSPKVISTEQFRTKFAVFLTFWCMLCTVSPDISSSSKNIKSSAYVSRLSFGFLWLWSVQFNLHF